MKRDKLPPFRITKRNQKQPIPQPRIGQARIRGMVRRVKNLTVVLEHVKAEAAKLDRMAADQFVTLPAVGLNGTFNGKVRFVQFKIAWVRQLFPNALSYPDVVNATAALEEAQKELELLAKDPVYAKYILLCKLRME